MKKSELNLYLKISPIYNKILQIALAVTFIVVLMNIWLESYNNQKQVIKQQLKQVGETYLQQTSAAVDVLLADRDLLTQYIEKISTQPLIRNVYYYDQTGRLLANAGKLSLAKDSVSRIHIDDLFTQEIRDEDDKLIGYLRLSIHGEEMTKRLNSANFSVHETMRLLIVFSILIGFLLTRGLNRFSRQGFRLGR